MILSMDMLKQAGLAGCASLGYMTVGLVRGFSSPGVPSMKETRPDLVPNTQVVSWICAVPPLGALLGSLVAGPVLGCLGRRGTLLTAAPLATAAWLLLAFSPDWKVLIAARALTGLTVGFFLPSAQLYVSECSLAGVRGTMGSLPAAFLAVGILAAYGVGWFLPWNRLALLGAALPLGLGLLLLPLPESPAWLGLKGRTKEAAAAASWLGLPAPGPPPPAPPALYSSAVLRPLSLVIALLILQQTSGIDVIIFYTVTIFKSSGSSLDEHGSTVVVGVVQLVATVASLLLVDRFGRRPLLLASALVMTLAMAILGSSFKLQEEGVERGEWLGLLPLASLITFITGYSIGFSGVPYLLMGEMLPLGRRSALSALSSAASLGSMFVVIKTFPDMEAAFGAPTTFWMYAGSCLFSAVFVWLAVPETRGKTFAQIEEMFTMTELGTSKGEEKKETI